MKEPIFQYIPLDRHRMTETDTVALCEAINLAFAEYEAFTGKPYLRFESHERFMQNLSDEDSHFLVVKRGAQFIAGVCFHTPSPESDTLYFGMLWVAPNERRQGIAEQLIQRIEEEAKHRNKKGLMIKLFKIPKLVQYYQALGFDFIEGNQAGPMVKVFT
ncbi:GNAT family N-acetyltransferase [Photobacterium aphoticum]|uniref:N-acetyltransferase domain-containing protein n=1 Tax=Photobacterium aphoticum TaxID=754436 RepID=A0A0J1GJM0_9GAMM|nr:GNAT family N-acetyltransferase [Photobacterium aphoticum]KLU99879.1 hypothetical protein ABT58_15560 [Photobacterium aphoticum]PSU56820.1 GNAT family N-acetyltransferase [Photobacterium aphoticum]GHA40719.1 hypothetical protein GCM10007086_12930 [Photobacterium aphoticum]